MTKVEADKYELEHKHLVDSIFLQRKTGKTHKLIHIVAQYNQIKDNYDVTCAYRENPSSLEPNHHVFTTSLNEFLKDFELL